MNSMKMNKTMKRLALALSLVAPSVMMSTSAAAAMKHECSPLTKSSFDTYADGKKVHVIFFASWCPGCRDHLLQKHKEPTVVINVWDKPGKAVEALKFTKVDTSKFPCFIDDKEVLAKGLKAPELPFAKDVDGKTLKAVLHAGLK